jgi:hypothetical protein
MFRVSRLGQVPQVETLDCRLDDAGRHEFRSADGRLAGTAGLAAWHTLECTPGSSQLIWLLGLALARAPYANVTGMWWEDRVDWCVPQASWRGLLARALRDLAGPFFGWDGVRVESRYTHATSGTGAIATTAHGALRSRSANQICLHTSIHPVGTAQSHALPKSVEVTLEPVRGITQVRAWFNHGLVDYRLGTFQLKTGEAS